MKNFWLRRIRRLVPAVMSMAVVIIFVSAVVNRIIFTKGCKDFLASVLGFNNWWQIFNKVSYFEAAGVPSPFTHCWSLAIETQFYLIYPLILLGIYKLVKSREEGRAKRGLLFAGVTLLLALISVILMIVLFRSTAGCQPGILWDRHESIFPFIRCITCNSVEVPDGSKKAFS